MTDKIDKTLVDDLRTRLEAAFNEPGTQEIIKKAADDLSYRLQDAVEWTMKDNLAPAIVGWVEEMATHAVAEMLNGNEDQVRRYLGCEKRGEDGKYIGWTGRSDSEYWGRQREPHEWHPVIHGRLFEQGAVELRKRIVDAHRDMLVNERILDLEDQVRSLVAQNNKLEAEKEAAL